MTTSNLGNNQLGNHDVMGSLDTPARSNQLPGDEIVIGSYDP